MNVTLYTRTGCHLCEAAETTIRRVVGDRTDVTLNLVDIDTDPVLVQRYTVRVPVVAVDGVEIAEYEVDEPTLRAALQPPAPAGDAVAGVASGSLSRPRGARLLRWVVIGVVGLVLLAGLTTASVALITPDLFRDACARPQLVRPADCPAEAS